MIQMALSFVAKRVAKKPIGTHVEVTIETGESLEKVTGVITASDFTTGLEITPYDGKKRDVELSLIKGCQEIKSLEDVLKSLTEGTEVQFSHGDEDNKTPNIFGTVSENDGESGMVIIPSSGKELELDYSLIRSMLVLSGSQPPEEEKTSEPEQKEEERPSRRKSLLSLPSRRRKFFRRNLRIC